jgi:RNA polymerase sigma-70 factor (ECF subfamily)
LTDADLLRAARSGDAEAWRTLYQRYLPSVWRQSYALVEDVHAAEDVTSEVMLALLEGIHRLETDVPKIAAWLRTVVRCKAADHYRKSFRSRDRLPLDSASADACQRDAGPAGALEVEETRNRVQVVLDELSDRQRVVLEWKYFDALRVREIAERLGETEKAVETVLYRARREFRRLFQSAESGRGKTHLRGDGSAAGARGEAGESAVPRGLRADVPQES